MSNLFEIKVSKMESNKAVVLGYAPSFSPKNTFFFSPIHLEHHSQINYEVGTEEGVIALLYNLFCKPEINLDLGYLSAESNVGEEELEELLDFVGEQPFNLVLTQDFLMHPSLQQILAWTKLIAEHSRAQCLIEDIPPRQDIKLSEYNGLVARVQYGGDILAGSLQFAKLAKLQDGDQIMITYGSYQDQVIFKLNTRMRGTIGILEVQHDFADYPYQRIKIL